MESALPKSNTTICDEVAVATASLEESGENTQAEYPVEGTEDDDDAFSGREDRSNAGKSRTRLGLISPDDCIITYVSYRSEKGSGAYCMFEGEKSALV
jgi:hypothetical protein